MGVFLLMVYVPFLVSGVFRREGREKILYVVLFAISLVASFAAGILARQDHIGASLSGMVSIFMR